MTANGKVKVTVMLPGELVFKAKMFALRESAERGARVTLTDLIEAGLRDQVKIRKAAS